MHLMHRYVASLFLTAALAAPVSMMAAPVPQEAGVQVRVYDSGHHDYHNWDEHERHAWGVYLSDNHRHEVEYAHATIKSRRNTGTGGIAIRISPPRRDFDGKVSSVRSVAWRTGRCSVSVGASVEL